MYVTSWFLNDDYEWFFFNVYRVWDLICFFTFNCGSIYSGIWGKWSAMYTSQFIGIELWFSMWKILLYIETVITYANRLQELHWLYDIHRQALNFIIMKFQSSLWPILHYFELTKFPSWLIYISFFDVSYILLWNELNVYEKWEGKIFN